MTTEPGVTEHAAAALAEKWVAEALWGHTQHRSVCTCPEDGEGDEDLRCVQHRRYQVEAMTAAVLTALDPILATTAAATSDVRWADLSEETRTRIGGDVAAAYATGLADGKRNATAAATPPTTGHVWRAVGPNAAELWNQCLNCRANEGSVQGRTPCPRATPPTAERIAPPCHPEARLMVGLRTEGRAYLTYETPDSFWCDAPGCTNAWTYETGAPL